VSAAKSFINLRLLAFIVVCLTSIFLVAGDSVTNTLAQSKEAELFKVIVKPSKNQVHVKETFKVALKVQNQTSTNQNLYVMSCSWAQHWRTDSDFIMSHAMFKCWENSPLTINLPPGDSYEKELPLWIPQPVSTNKISFRMVFNPLNCPPPLKGTNRSDFVSWVDTSFGASTNMYLSDLVTVEVIP
jgi:hypothetical protein